MSLYIWEISTEFSPKVLTPLIYFLSMFSLSQSVLQGFTCAAARELDAESLQDLAKAMKEKNVELGEDQVSFHISKCGV